MLKVIVVGGGPAGMMAAYAAAACGAQVTLIEKNEKLGKKLFITGKGRCNLTNACEVTEFFDNVMRNPKFLYSAVYGFDNSAVMDFFEKSGVTLKTERGGRVFPASDHSSDVIKAMERSLSRAGVKVLLNTGVCGIALSDGRRIGINDAPGGDFDGAQVTGVVVSSGGGFDGRESAALGVVSGGRESGSSGAYYEADRVILATGGVSYRSTGSTGDGIVWASHLGHRAVKCEPSLVPLVCKEEYVKALQGLSLKNVKLTLFDGKKKLFDEQGELLFTHFGISGPLVLSASAMLPAGFFGDAAGEFSEGKCPAGLIDLKPALSEQQLDARLLRDFEKNNNRDFVNALDELLPKKLIPVAVQLSGIDPHKKVNKVSRQERLRLLEVLKGFPLTVTGCRGFEEAIITRGGVSVKDIDASTMESKTVKGLFFAGEMMDVDALTGGYNLQIAWSTGHLAGESAAGD